MNTQTAQLSKHLQNVLSNGESRHSCELIQTLIEIDADKDAKRIELANVDGEILALIVVLLTISSIVPFLLKIPKLFLLGVHELSLDQRALAE